MPSLRQILEGADWVIQSDFPVPTWTVHLLRNYQPKRTGRSNTKENNMLVHWAFAACAWSSMASFTPQMHFCDRSSVFPMLALSYTGLNLPTKCVHELGVVHPWIKLFKVAQLWLTPTGWALLFSIDWAPVVGGTVALRLFCNITGCCNWPWIGMEVCCYNENGNTFVIWLKHVQYLKSSRDLLLKLSNLVIFTPYNIEENLKLNVRLEKA